MKKRVLVIDEGLNTLHLIDDKRTHFLRNTDLATQGQSMAPETLAELASHKDR